MNMLAVLLTMEEGGIEYEGLFRCFVEVIDRREGMVKSQWRRGVGIYVHPAIPRLAPV
jgi:hypothetical protein